MHYKLGNKTYLYLCADVYFTLRGETYANNSVVSMSKIGEGDDALLCRTDKVECCGKKPNRFGEFFDPNGEQVPTKAAGKEFYRNRGSQMVRLNRRNEASGSSSMLTGVYKCEVPDKDNVMQRVYIHLVQ